MGKPRHHAQDSARRASGNPWAQRRAARPRWYARSPPSCCPRRGRSRSLDTIWYQNPMWSKVTWESCPRSQPLLGTYDPTPPAHLRQAARPTAQSRLLPHRGADPRPPSGRAPRQINRGAGRSPLDGSGRADRGSRPTVSPRLVGPAPKLQTERRDRAIDHSQHG